MKMDRCQSKGVAGGAFCKRLKRNGMDGGKQRRLEQSQSSGIGRGGYTPIAMERVRKRLKGKGLWAPIVQKSPEAVEKKGVE
jgi:hypothetical protein